MDILNYDYDSGNKLTKVTDNGNDAHGFKDGTNTNDDFEYDINGNLKIDRNKGITSIEYNYLNLPTQLTVSGTNNGTINYVYAADGSKLNKTTSTGLQVDYAGGYVYNNDVLQFFPHPEGYVSVENGNYNYVYNYLDHLGNIRLSYTDGDGNGSIDPTNEIVEENNFYPMGMKHKGYNEVVSSLGNSIAKKWKFQGVEFEQALDIDLYEMGFRNYDPAIGRFMSIDPLAGEREWLTPYNFVQNNPLTRIDPSGLLDDFVLNEDGTLTKIAETDTADRIFAQDNNGDVIEDEFVTLEKDEQVESNPKKRARTTSGEEFDFQIIPFEDSAVAAEVFEFVSDNSEVEFAQVDTELGSTVSTSFFKGRDKSQGISIRRFIKEGAKNIFARHSHPRNSEELLQAAAGLGRISQTPSDGDIKNAQSRVKEFPNVNFSFQVYDPIFSTNYNYNAQGFQRKVPTIQKPVKL